MHYSDCNSCSSVTTDQSTAAVHRNASEFLNLILSYLRPLLEAAKIMLADKGRLLKVLSAQMVVVFTEPTSAAVNPTLPTSPDVPAWHNDCGVTASRNDILANWTTPSLIAAKPIMITNIEDILHLMCDWRKDNFRSASTNVTTSANGTTTIVGVWTDGVDCCWPTLGILTMGFPDKTYSIWHWTPCNATQSPH